MATTQNENSNDIEQSVENVPVHTMQQDLAEIANPSAAKTKSAEIEDIYKRKPVVQESLSAAQKTSPFLNPKPEAQPVVTQPAQDISPFTAKNAVPTGQIPPIATKDPLPVSSGTKHSSKKTFILLAAGLALLMIIAGSGYYFWSTRKQTTPPIATPEPTPEPTPTPEPAPTPAPAVTFSTDQPNYLNIATADSAGIKSALADYADKVSKSGLTAPIEFIVTDQQNNPITFSSFASSFGLKLSSGVTADLADTFSIFLYNDQGAVRLGLAVDSKNDPFLQTNLTREEKNLVSDLSPLFLDNSFTPPTSLVFNKSTYANANIRYANINSSLNPPLSIDYAIFNKKLIIGTSKMTLRAILDKSVATAPAVGQ